MSYFVQVIRILVVALLYTKCTSALMSTNYEADNMCSGMPVGPNHEVNQKCSPSPGNCRQVSIDFSDLAEWQTRMIGICYNDTFVEQFCVTRSKEWMLQHDDAAHSGIVCKVYENPVPSTENPTHRRTKSQRKNYRKFRRHRNINVFDYPIE